MNRLFFPLYLLLASFFLSAKGQECVIRGRIYDLAGGEGLPGANILYKNNRGTVAGAQGSYRLKLEPGSVSLTIRHIGFKTTTRSLKLSAGDSLVLDVGLENEVSEIDQVVVSAGRIEQRISELSVSMNLIKPDLISNRHITDTKELITKTSGIEVMDGQASVRGGSGFSYGAGSRVLALIDGLPAMSADAGNIRWQSLPLENISQIEIIKGASSVVYGSSALNGVINFRTADASMKPDTRFYLESGLFDTPANKNWKWWNTPRAFSSASFSHLQKMGNTDFAMGLHLLTDNGYRRLNDQNLGRLNFKLKHFNKNHEGLTYGLAFNGGTSVKTDFVLWENGTTGALKHNESTAIEVHQYFFNIDPFISYQSGLNSKHDFRARLQSSRNRFPESPQNDSQPFNAYAEYQFAHKFSEIVSMSAGVSENMNRINSNFYGDHNGLNVGLFTQLDVNATQRMRLTSGVRLEQNWLDGEADKLTPLFRAGLNYRALDYTYLRASFGQGYRFPSIAEKYASTTLGSVRIFPSLYIQPEKGWNAEIGAKQGIMTDYFGGVLDLALFYSRNIDMIEYIFGIYPDPGKETFSYGFKASNMEASRVYGCEVQYSLTRNVGRFRNTLSGGYVFMYPVEFNKVTGKNTGVMLKYRRKHSATVNFNTSYEKFDFGIGLYLKSKILNIDDVFVNPLTRESLLPGFYDYWIRNNNGYFLADVNLGYALTPKYNLSFVVKNLTNTEYMGRPGDIQPQRSFSLRFSGNF